ncbi:MAG: HDOD domain-containing protein [Candidatus Eremiobacterota bacterium]
MNKINTLKIKDLPVFPDILLNLNRVLHSKSVTIDTVNTIIERDPALTAKILKLANSSYYGLSYMVGTLKKAITVLGFNTIRNLAVTVSVSGIFTANTSRSVDVQKLWHHSIGCAIASKSLLTGKNPLIQEKAFMGGILHDIGKIIILLNFPEDTKKIIEKIRGNKLLTESEAERELLGFDHADLGSFIAEKWHFPKELACSISLHHNPEQFPSFTGKLENREEAELLVYTIYTGNQIAKAMALGTSSDPLVSNINPTAWQKLGITEKDLPSVILKIKENFKEVIDSWNM